MTDITLPAALPAATTRDDDSFGALMRVTWDEMTDPATLVELMLAALATALIVVAIVGWIGHG